MEWRTIASRGRRGRDHQARLRTVPEGAPEGEVARILNHCGHRSRQGKPWTGMTVGRLLAGTAAIGEYAIKSTGESVPCKPIVTREIWDKVQDLLAEQKDPEKRPSAKVVHALSGLVVCGACAGKMYPRNGKYLCADCRNTVSIERIENDFIGELEDYWRARKPSDQPAKLHETWPAMTARQRRNLAESLVEMFVGGEKRPIERRSQSRLRLKL